MDYRIAARGRSQLFTLLTATWWTFGFVETKAAYIPLEPLPSPQIVKHAEAYPGGSYEPSHLLDGKAQTEYASNNQGTNTFVTVQFPQTVRIAAVRHRDRDDPATVSRSEWIFTDESGQVTGVVSAVHSGARGGETLSTLSNAVSARTVQWRVTALGPAGLGTVGGAELSFFGAGAAEATPTRDRIEAQALPFVEKSEGGTGLQPIKLRVSHPYAQAAQGLLRVPGLEPLAIGLKPGTNALEIKLPVVQNRRLYGRLAQRPALLGAHLGRRLQHQPAREPKDARTMGDQARVRLESRSRIAAALRLRPPGRRIGKLQGRFRRAAVQYDFLESH